MTIKIYLPLSYTERIILMKQIHDFVFVHKKLLINVVKIHKCEI